MLDDTEIPVECPECGHKSRKTIGYLKASPEFACPGCGVTIKVNGDKLKLSTERVDQKVADFRRKTKYVSSSRLTGSVIS